MRRFKDLIKNKFVWGPKDVVHGDPEKKETKAERAEKFIWLPGDLEHHDKDGVKKESLDEKFQIAPETKGNFGKPHKHETSPYSHPLDRPSAHTGHGVPDEGDESHDAFMAHHDSLDSHEEEAVTDYKHSGHREINKHLRGAYKRFKKEKAKAFNDKKKESGTLKFKDDPEHHKHLKAGEKIDWSRNHDHENHHHDDDDDDDYDHYSVEDRIHHLDHVTNHRTVEHHVVFRGGIPGDKTRFPIGHEYTDHGYASTSFRRKKAKSFAQSHAVMDHEKGYKQYKEHVHVIHVPKGSRGHYLDVKGEDSSHSHHEEKEFLLHRGTRFKVTHHSEDGDSHYIHSRVIKQGIRQKFRDSKQKKEPEVQPKDNHGLPGQHKFPFMKHHKRFK